MKKNKYLLFLTFLLFFLFLATHFAFALEVPLPGLCPSSGTCSPTLPEYVVYIFKFAISIAGVLSVLSFAVGAVQLIGSADNAQTASDAKDRMKGAVIGLILTAASTIIIITINPVLKTPLLPPVQQLGGVYYDDANNTPTPHSDDSANVPEGSSNLVYKCSGNTSNAPGVLVWTFPNPGLENGNGDLSGVTVSEMQCGGTTAIGDGSFKWAFDAPGVYFCLGGCSGDMCSGYMSGANTASVGQLDDTFNTKLAAVRIVNDQKNNKQYGVIFHNEAGLENGGLCNYPKINTGSAATCESVDNDMEVSALDIFALDKTSTAGNGVTFYSKPTGWNTDSGGHKAAGFYPPKDNSLDFTNVINEQTSAMCYDYTNVDVPDAYKFKCSGSKCGGNDNSGGDCGNGQPMQTCPDGSKSCNCPAAYNNKTQNIYAAVSPALKNNFVLAAACTPGESCTCTDGSTGYCSGDSSCQGCGSTGNVCDCGNGEPASEACCTNTKCSDSACETFEDCPGSIEIKGSYLVGIFSEDLLMGDTYCQTFAKTVPNLNVQDIIASGSEETGQIYIIPVQ